MSRRVAAPRFTAVGLALYKKSKRGRRCALRVSGEDKKAGVGDAWSARVRCAENDSAAREAIAGAPRIYLAIEDRHTSVSRRVKNTKEPSWT